MHKIKKKMFTTGFIIFSFSLIITFTFIGMFLLFGISKNQQIINDGGIYLLSNNDYKNVIENNGILNVDITKMVGQDEYREQYLHYILVKLIPLSFLFLIFLFLLSCSFWMILKKIKNKTMIKIAEQLTSTTTVDISTNLVSDEPALTIAYTKIKQKHDDHLEAYKRLNSYLSHEQKNSLAILRTNMELAGQTEYLNSLANITDGIDDILTLSENIEMTTFSTVDVSLTCAEVCDNYKIFSNQIIFDFDEEENTEIEGRQRWIYRAIANLLDNAIKYGNGKLIHVSVKAKKGSVIIAIKDNGIGISKEKCEKIFNNRYRIDELNMDGYGIGLSLVSHVCDLCGGFVIVESELGKGSSFYLSFPQKCFLKKSFINIQ